MPPEDTQVSETTMTTTPDPVDYSRFKEVIDEKNANAARADAAEARAAVAEQAWQAQRTELASLARTVEERLPAPAAPPEQEWQDPADVALAGVKELLEWKTKREADDRKNAELSDDRRLIEKALRDAGVDDMEAGISEVAKAYFAAKQVGLDFDPALEAVRHRKVERALLALDAAENDNNDNNDKDAARRQTAQATASAITGQANAGSPAPDAPPSKRPSRLDADWTQEGEDQWVEEKEEAILAKYR